MNNLLDLLNPTTSEESEQNVTIVNWIFEERKKPLSSSNLLSSSTSTSSELPSDITIYRDKQCQVKVEDGDCINKDILHYFTISKNLLLKRSSTTPDNHILDLKSKNFVYIDDAVFYRGNRKKDQRPRTFTSIVLSGCVKYHGAEVAICRTCSVNGSSNLLIRNCEELPSGDYRITASIKCGGEPVGSDRQVVVSFEFRWGGSILWKGDSSSLRLLHHRRKLPLSDTAPTIEKELDIPLKMRKIDDSDEKKQMDDYQQLDEDQYWPEVLRLREYLLQESRLLYGRSEQTIEPEVVVHLTLKIINNTLSVIRDIPESSSKLIKNEWVAPPQDKLGSSLPALTADPNFQQRFFEYCIGIICKYIYQQ